MSSSKKRERQVLLSSTSPRSSSDSSGSRGSKGKSHDDLKLHHKMKSDKLTKGSTRRIPVHVSSHLSDFHR